ncbi:MAG: DUF5518 domain-containing protein [Vicinamibacterales bacterium]
MAASTTTRAGYLKPALLGGLVSGVLSALPVVSAGNLCCCLWVVTGGLVAAYLLQHDRRTPIGAADGAIVGLLAGAVGAGVQLALSIPIGLLVGPMEREMVRRLLDTASALPPGTREALDQYARGEGAGLAGAAVRVLSFVVILFAGSLVSAVAGIVGAAVFTRPSESTTTPTAPTTPTTPSSGQA